MPRIGFYLEQDDLKARSECIQRGRNDGKSNLLGENMFAPTEDPRKYKAINDQAKSWYMWGLRTTESEELTSKAHF